MSKEKITPHDVAKNIIRRADTVVKTSMDNDIIYLYDKGHWNYRNSEARLKKQIQTLLGEDTTEYLIREILGHIRRETYTEPQELEQNRRYICLNNFVRDIEKNTIMGFSPKRFVTIQIPITHNSDQPTTEIENYCKTLVYPKDVPRLQEHLGDILSPHTATKKICLLYGDKNSGKSTLLHIIQRLLTQENYCSLTLKELGEKFTNFNIYGKLANICSEAPYKLTTQNLEHIKALTGGDTITIQQKYGKPFAYRPIIKHIFAANGIPRIGLADADEAFYSRFDFIQFPNSFKPDPSIIPKYTTESMKSAWFNWMLEGYHRLKDNGWQFTNQLDIGNVERLFATAGIERDEFLVWLTENYIPSPSDHIEKKQMHKGYLEHCNTMVISSRYRYPYESFCKRMLNIKDFPILSARRGPKGKQNPVFMGIKKLNR